MAAPRKGRGKQPQQDELFGFGGVLETRSSNDVIGEIRHHVGVWRRTGYPNVTPTTRRLLEYWSNETRQVRLFFAQLEAVETAIYLTEIGTKLGKGWIGEQVAAENERYNAGLPRVALKMATGAGKTVVMAMLIAWHTLNKVASPQDARFTKKFLLVTPGITIRDRLRVLRPEDPNNYYTSMDLVPADLRTALGQARVAITNFHNFKPKATREGEGLASNTKKFLLGNSKRPDAFAESPDQMVNRVLRDLGGGDKSQIIVINDEGHHCYQTRAAALDGAVTADQLKGDERRQAEVDNDTARLWFDGLRHVARKAGVKQIYDLSATPSYLTGSGYPQGLLFPWVVSDFGLLDAIESGLVKIPRVPVDDDAAHKQVSYLNLWTSIPEDDRRRLASGRPTAGDNLPAVVDGALRSLYRNYEEAYRRWGASRANGSTPPVFIVVCANTKISKWVYDKIAGYEVDGQARPGELSLFSNYDENGRLYDRPRTIIVDSVQLESDEAKLSAEFKVAAEAELKAFHDEYEARYPGRSASELGEKDLLREVLNTVGKKDRLGQHVRCVVSVSMLTEGWDANTVTHILGIRAFGSSLLCEQVVGRGLRRISYEPNAEGLLEPEYAEVYGIPFQFIQTDPTKTLESKPKPIPVRVHTVADRTAQRIVFPRLDGYRIEIEDEPYRADFSEMPRFIVHEAVATKGTAAAIIGEDIDYSLPGRDGTVRPQHVAFLLGEELLRRYRDPTGGTKPWLFPNLVALAKEWIRACVGDDNQKTLVTLVNLAEERERAVEQLRLVIERQQRDRTSLAKLLPVFQRYTPEGSTDAVDFFTTKSRYEADPDKCPVNYVVLDGRDDNTWERSLAELLEARHEIDAYVKNDHLEFAIPYSYAGRAHRYMPDFIARLAKRDAEDVDRYLIIEVSGTLKSQGPRKIKAQTARDQWCAAVNDHGGYGVWGYTEVDDPNHFKSGIVTAIHDLYQDGSVTGLHSDALPTEHFTDEEDALFAEFFITQTAGTGEGN